MELEQYTTTVRSNRKGLRSSASVPAKVVARRWHSLASESLPMKLRLPVVGVPDRIYD